MKKSLVILAAMAFVIVMAGGAYAADTTADVNASASIANVCVLGGTGAIAFGALDQITGAAVSNVAATGYTLWCTKSYSATVAISNGDNYTSTRNLSNGTDVIPYTLAWNTTVTGQGKSTDLLSAVALEGNIASGAYADVSSGSYSDKVVITITY